MHTFRLHSLLTLTKTSRGRCRSADQGKYVVGQGRQLLQESPGMGAVPFYFLQASPRLPGKYTGNRPCLIKASSIPTPTLVRCLKDPRSPPRTPRRDHGPPNRRLHLFFVARRLRGSSCHRAAATASVGWYSDPITFPNPSTTPAVYTREIRIHLAPGTPTELIEYMPYFSNALDLTLIGGR